MASSRSAATPRLATFVFPRICTLMSWICLGAILVVALWLICLIVPTVMDSPSMGCTINGKPCNKTWTDITLLVVPIGLAIFTGPLIWGLWSASRCFRGLAQGRYFDPRTARAFRNFGLGVLVHKSLLYFGPWLLKTSGHLIVKPEKGIHLSGTFSIGADPLLSERALTLILLVAIVIAAHVFARATQIADENAQFV